MNRATFGLDGIRGRGSTIAPGFPVPAERVPPVSLPSVSLPSVSLPTLSVPSVFAAAVLVPVVLAFGLLGCGPDAVTDAALGDGESAIDRAASDADPQAAAPSSGSRLADDPDALATWTALQQRMQGSANRLAPAELDTLRGLYDAHPEESILFAALNNALVAREDWEGLRDLYAGRDDLTPAQRVTLGKVYVRLGDWDRAEAVLLPLADAQPDEADLAYYAARVERHLGQRAAAGARLDRVMETLRATDHVDALIIRGMVDLETGEADAARGLFEDVLAIDPDSQAALDGLGRAFVALGQRAQAAAAFATLDAVHLRSAEDKGRQMRLSAGAEALKAAFQARDLPAAERLVDTMLAEAEDPSLRQTLHEYAAEIYAATNRAPAAADARATAAAIGAATGGGANGSANDDTSTGAAP